MAFKQVVKFKRKYVPPRFERNAANDSVTMTESNVKNNSEKIEETMDQRVSKAEEIMNNMKAENNVKIVKKDKGLIERTESSKIVLTEDNRQVLND